MPWKYTGSYQEYRLYILNELENASAIASAIATDIGIRNSMILKIISGFLSGPI